MAFTLSAARRTIATSLVLLLSACASTFDPNAPVAFYTDVAVPVDKAAPYLAEVVGQRITIRGVPRQNEGSCSGVQPLSRKDWMLTGKEHCLWVNGRTEEVRLLDLRGSQSKAEVSVTGELVKTDSGVLVLKVDRP